MTNTKFYEILSNAKNDEVSLIIAVNKIMPLINKYSIINNQIDEDLRSYLIEYAIKLIKSDDFGKRSTKRRIETSNLILYNWTRIWGCSFFIQL